ncbi:hypothetical protein VZT92_016955 [Zoarces viviparus]|uniref:Uncharacterized protein n=1 Tax=Zoarces viviparus TaxID=48416 RepID=A0AAW1EQX4_ZOAVI
MGKFIPTEADHRSRPVTGGQHSALVVVSVPIVIHLSKLNGNGVRQTACPPTASFTENLVDATVLLPTQYNTHTLSPSLGCFSATED